MIFLSLGTCPLISPLARWLHWSLDSPSGHKKQLFQSAAAEAVETRL